MTGSQGNESGTAQSTMARSEISQLHRAVGQLRQCVGTLRSQYGDSVEVRRLSNDVERLDIDVAEVAGERSAAGSTPRARPVPREETVVVSDTPYDPDLWKGADDEGVGGYHQHG